MRNIIVTESQYNMLNEARMDGFRIDALRNMSFAARVRYCTQWLGKPIGNGSSRIVFQLDDETVLKLAKNKKGIAQNEHEFEQGNDWYINYLFPRVMNGSDEENYMWIVSEFVLPATKKDFEHCLHMNFADVMEAIRSVRWGWWKITRQFYEKNKDNYDFVDFLSNMEDYINGYDNKHGDTQQLANWGLAMREGKPTLVLLDSGVNNEILKQYYTRG